MKTTYAGSSEMDDDTPGRDWKCINLTIIYLRGLPPFANTNQLNARSAINTTINHHPSIEANRERERERVHLPTTSHVLHTCIKVTKLKRDSEYHAKHSKPL